ncbi:hypothetical protein K0M31_018777 [Melipona bicolor]|uniref:Uncharacterized protein n=1 Tax=Melipona bicolor TaxID=60889 RepID=A0AA40KS09_9HYME|nr:hypothetical protein K0M31_018777 [Melipona bicolor]
MINITEQRLYVDDPHYTFDNLVGAFWDKVGTTVRELNGGLVLQTARGIDAWRGLNSLWVNREHVACFVLEAVIRITLDRTEDNPFFVNLEISL